MSRLWKITQQTLVLMVCLCTAASANIVIDLDPKEGDQGVKEAQVKPGDMKEIELIAQQGAKDIEGFEVALRFDPQQFDFKGFQPSGLMTGAIALPPQKTPDGVKISVGFLGRRSPGDAGSLGKIQLQVTAQFNGTGTISLVEGSFGAKGQTQKFPLASTVTLTTGASKGAIAPTTQQPPNMNNQPPQGQGNQGGFQNQQPPQGQGYHGGQQGPSDAAMRQMFNRWLQSPQRADLNNDRRITMEDFKIWYDKNQGGQQGNQGGFQNQQPPQGQGYHGGQQGGFQNQGNQQGQGNQGNNQGNNQGGFQNQQPQGQGYHGGQQGQMGPQGGMMGDMGGQLGEPDPEKAIAQLPTALQGSFMETWKFSERAHLEAELKSQERILKTLAETAQYVAKASEEEKKQIAQVLMFFHMGGGEHGGPGEHGKPGEHGGQMGQPQMPQNADINDLIKKMTEDVTRDMEEIKKALSTM